MTPIRQIIFLLLQTTFFFAQNKDSLVIGTVRLELVKSKVYFTQVQGNQIDLPSEYLKKGVERKIEIDCQKETSFELSWTYLGDEAYAVLYDKNARCFRHSIEIHSLIDTITVDSKHSLISPYLLKNRKKIYALSYSVLAIDNDTLTEFTFKSGKEMSIIQLENTASRTFSRQAIYIVKNLYYRQGVTTYYYDCSFILRQL
jgi:hypothetical protein